MPTNRKVIFANDEIYHVFNRGVEKRPTFTDKRELGRGLITLDFYRLAKLPLKLSRFLNLAEAERAKFRQDLNTFEKLVEIICYCLMPNHFHLLLKQKLEGGISTFVANFTNSYTRYFNTRHERIGPLFQGLFKAVLIESDEQLIHVSRYIHLNPVSSLLIEPDELESYQWSSFPEYMGSSNKNIASPKLVLDLLPSKEKYKQFVLDQVDHARKLEQIKHLILE
ncbi:transposase [Candidatus Daviesbacteria bacterium]|nr:transposase [Candidatus Daviesbacteria bacterium]